MKVLEIEGVRREQRVKTTNPDSGVRRHPDLVNRVFKAEAPNQLWVTDLTFVPNGHGLTYLGFAIDAYSSAIAGWRCVSNTSTETVLAPLEQAR